MTRIAQSVPFPITGVKVNSDLDVDVRGESYIDITFIINLMDGGTSIDYLVLGTNDAVQWEIVTFVPGAAAGPIAAQTFVHATRLHTLKYQYYRVVFETQGTFLADFSVTVTANNSTVP